jgi:hypothetical protein
VLLSNILSSIQVGIEAIATVATEEKRLRTSIVSGLMPATRTGLTRVPRVYFLDTDPFLVCLIGQKRVKLCKAPTVETALCFRMFLHPDARADMGQILDHNGAASRGVLHDAFREDVIMVFALPKQFATQLFEMSLGRFGAFGLQFAFEAEDMTLLLFPASFPQEMFIRGDCRTIESPIHANDFIRGNNLAFISRSMERRQQGQ